MLDGPTGPILVSPTGTTCTFAAPTSAVLDAWRAIVSTATAGSGQGGNISCALTDADTKLGLDDPELDTELTICSIGNESFVTFYNVAIALVGLRDKSIADTGLFNLYTNLFNAADIRYAFVDRLGEPSTGTFSVGDVVSLYEAYTDAPLDQKADRGNLKLAENPIPTGVVNVNYALLT